MSWAAVVSGKARHSSTTSPAPFVAASATATVTIQQNPLLPQRNPHIPIASHSPIASPQLHSVESGDTTPTNSDSLPSPTHSHPKSPSSNQSSDDSNYNPDVHIHQHPDLVPTPASQTSPASRTSPAPPHHQQNHNRNRIHNKQKNLNKPHHYHQPPTPQSPQKRPQKHAVYNHAMWNDPHTVAIYRLWTQHISTFMAQPVHFYHIFIMNLQFRQSVFDAGLTFHPDTDPASPVLINLNSSRFGMAERISALSPPAGLDTRAPLDTRSISTPAPHQISPLSEPSLPPQNLHPPLSTPFLGPNVANVFKTTNPVNGAVVNGDPSTPYDALTNGAHPANLHESDIVVDPNAVFYESLAHRFAESTRLDVSDSESERLSEGDPNSMNGSKPPSTFPFEKARPLNVPSRRRNGRSRVVSRVLDIRIPPHPICKHQCDKSKVEFIEQIGEIFPRITPTPEHSKVRTNTLARLRTIISDEWNGAGINVYGSAGNGLGLRSADVDMSLYMPDEVAAAHGKEEGKPDTSKAILARLAEIMEEKDMVILSKVLDARVPVIKMQDPVSRLQVDVCVNNTLAVRNTELLKAYVDLDERFRYVCILVKLWAKRRELNDAYHGTLSSYAYTLLVIHYMQAIQPPVLPCLQRMVGGSLVSSDDELPTEMTDNGSGKLYNTYFDRTVSPETYDSANTQPVHELLMGFFKYYAYTFKYRIDLASIRLGVKTPRSARGWDESAVYAEWEAKQAQYKKQLDAARLALDARRKSDGEDKKSREDRAEGTDEMVTEATTKRERIQFPRRPRLASKHLFCIEDPFDIDHDLSRGMEKAAVSVIRQEMMRAYELIAETGDYELVCEEYR